MEIFINAGLSILGVAIVVWWNAVRSPRFDKFVWGVWVRENLEAIGLTFMGILLLSVLNLSSPESLEMVHTMTGIDLADTRAGWVLFGVSMYELIRKLQKSSYA